QLKDYGQARQITLFEHGQAVLQILTSDLQACPAEILSWLKSRWREENFLKYASQNYGTGKICDYAATIGTAPDKTPAKLPANVISPDARRALLRASRRILQMILRLLAHNAEHWLSAHLNAY